ncbi:MAG TPA: hypothetical protein VGB17_19510 [Pyrinomonadaceae bacterium]|jgi:hypothetical protein
MFRLSVIILCCLVFVSPALSLVQENPGLDKSRIPVEANNVKAFAPLGWKIEEQVSGDLNNDAIPDYALKLIEDKPAEKDADTPQERQRALVVVFSNKAGKLSRAAVADKLLQCTSCGGAFYGMVEAPANVKIEKGVLIVNQDHGSRNVTEATYRFRYDPQIKQLVLIGLDVVDRDRATAEVIAESTNYLTGLKVVKSYRAKGRDLISRKRVSREKISIEQVDHESFEEVGQ